MDRHVFHKTFWGLALIAIGFLFLLDRLQLLEFDLGRLATTYWPCILIYFGLYGIIWNAGRGGGPVFWNGFLMLLGTFLLLRNLNVAIFEDVDFSKFIVPGVIILIGLSMLSGGRGRRRRYARPPGNYVPDPLGDPDWRASDRKQRKYERKLNRFREKMERKFGVPPGGAAAGGYTGNEPHSYTFNESGADHTGHHWEKEWMAGRPMLQRSSFIGDVYLGQDYWTLEPTFVSHFIGDTVIDLTKAMIPFGETKLAVSTFIGDVKVFVPNDIQVEVSVRSNAFVGEMKVLDRLESGLFKTLQYESPYYAEAEKKIRLDIQLFIGDVQVRRIG